MNKTKIIELPTSQEEYRVGALHCLDTAQRHFKVAQQAGESGEYAIAISLFIISLEEISKGSVFQIKSFGLDVNNVDKYLRDHTTKHENAYKLFSVTFADLFSDILEKTISDLFSEENLKENSWILVFLGIVIFCGLLSDKEKEKENVNEKEVKLEEIRQSGLYVDYKNGQWKVPSLSFTQEDYQKAKEYIEILFQHLETNLFAESSFDSENIMEFVKKLDSCN